MRLDVAFVDAPATPRREITIIGLDSVLFESPIAGKMTGILPENSFIEVIEGGISLGVLRGDSGPLVSTMVAGGPFGESFELACSVASVVPAVASAAFPFVLEVALEGLGE
jgi:hypothetical protein